jgi:hypothetical protein
MAHSYRKQFLVLTLGIFCLAVAAQETQPGDTLKNKPSAPAKKYFTTRLTTARPVIDGKLDDACWKTGNWEGNFIQFIPDEGGKPSQPTEFNIQYDDRYIYVAMRAHDREPNKIQRYAGVRDEFVGEQMGVNFDSYHDRRTGFEFDLTAYGQKIDIVLTNPMLWDVSWNPVWKGKSGMEDSAWVAEMEIPLSQLRYSKETEQVWGLHVWRWIARLQEESDWEKQTLTGPGVLYNFGELHGISNLKKSARVEIMPYALGKLSTFAKESANPFADKGRDWKGTVGLDAKVGISSNFTMDITVNPDFGQVESDPSVMNLTAFETFYEEKRPFFLEGKTIFNYDFDDLNLFYSRRIGHQPSYSVPFDGTNYVKSPDNTTILDAVKISGKTADGLSVGILQSLTAAEYAHLDDGLGKTDKTTVEPLTSYTVARVQKDYNQGTTMIGGMITSTNRFINDAHLDFLDRNAYTGGLDLLHQWKDKKYYVDARLVGSYVNGSELAIRSLQESSARYYQRPGADYLNYDTTLTRLSGSGGKVKIGKGSGLWRYNASLSFLTPGLELNDIGYMQSADAIHEVNEISYFVNQPVSIFRTYTINLEQFNDWNFNGSYVGSGAHLSASANFLNKWTLAVNLIGHSRQLDTHILRGGPDMLTPGGFMTFNSLQTDNSKRIMFILNGNYKTMGENYASSWEVSPGVSLRPVNALKIGITADLAGNHDQLQYVNTLSYGSDYRYILGTIDQKTMGFTFRVDYSITPELSVQFYGSPFVSRGRYQDFKRITDPMNETFTSRYHVFDSPVLSGGAYGLDETGDGISDYSLYNPDFNFHQFRSNLVAKWEFRPGSFLYLVWSSDRTNPGGDPSSTLGKSFGQLWNVFPNNIFLIKFSYWFST